MGVQVDYQNKITVKDLDTVYITGAGHIRYPFKGVGRDSKMGWEEPVFSGELNRNISDGVFTNILDVDFFLVARCELVYKYMNIQDYKVLREMAKERVLTVDFFNSDNGKRVIREMAIPKQESGKLYAFGEDYLGRQDVKINLVATNRDIVGMIKTEFTISYNSNGGTGSAETKKVFWSENIQLNNGSAFNRIGYRLKEFNTKADGSGAKYLPNQNVTIWQDLILYAIWE